MSLLVVWMDGKEGYLVGQSSCRGASVRVGKFEHLYL
jgi:hypothetical protein